MTRLILMAGALACLAHTRALAQPMASAPVHLDIGTAGARLVVIRSLSGKIEIAGRPSVQQVEVKGERRGSSAAVLDRVGLSLTRSGDTIFVVGHAPRDLDASGEAASLDVVVALPGDLPVVLEECAREVRIHDVGALTIRDGSGIAIIERVHGNVSVSKSSGTTEIKGVVGSVELDALGSGRIALTNVSGSVRLHGAKKTGSIAVHDVGGDLIVGAAVRSRLTYGGVQGRVLAQ